MNIHKNCPIFIGLIGFGFLATGLIFGWYIFPKVSQKRLHAQIALTKDNKVFDMFVTPPFPIKVKFYFFNVLNPEEVQNGANPVVREVGPYIYETKLNVTIDEEADSISYMVRRRYHFNAKESGCRSDEDIVILANPIVTATAMQVSSVAQSLLPMIETAVPHLFPGIKDIFIRAKVRDILFDGVPITCDDEIEFVCGALDGMELKTLRKAEKGEGFYFSIMNYYNTTLDGPFEIGRGLKNTTKGKIINFRGYPNIRYWAGPTCNMVNGTDASVFPPVKNISEKMYFFTSEMCRSLYYTFEKEVVFQGMRILRYVNPPEEFSLREENACFCTDSLLKNCPPSGIIDVSPCYRGPALMSLPHFLFGDQKLIDFVEGVKPEVELHQSHIEIEPVMGVPFRGNFRIQMNAEVIQLEQFSLMRNVTPGIYPILWMEQGAHCPQDIVDLIKSGLYRLYLLEVTKWILVIFGLSLIIISFIMAMVLEKMCCFAESNKVRITREEKTTESKERIAVSNLSLSEAELNPKLYPQVQNWNTSVGLTRRGNNGQQIVWPFHA